MSAPGKNRKGFFHIVEIVIISLVMFVVIFQMSSLSFTGEDWSRAELRVKGRDIIQALDTMGTNWMDGGEVDSRLSYVINNSNVNYRLYSGNLPDSIVNVGCFFCTPEEWNRMVFLLRDIEINNVGVSFQPIAPSEELLNEADVMVVFDARLESWESEIVRYLEQGKGLVQMRHFTQEEIEDDSVQGGIFGISWNSSLPSHNSNNITFTPGLVQGNRYYPIKSWFYHIENSSEEFFEEPHEFSYSLLAGEKVQVTDLSQERVVLRQLGTNLPACIVRDGVIGGSGRTVWLADGPDTDEKAVLFTSLVAWASPQRRVIIDNDISKPVGSLSFFTVLGDEMYQPVELTLELGYLY